MTHSPCQKCPHRQTPKNEMPCAACPDPAEYAESLGSSIFPTLRDFSTLRGLSNPEPYKPQYQENETMSPKEKKPRGCPPGGWPKKDLPESSKPLPEIQNNTHSPIPESSHSKNTPLKFDLSAFKKITFDRRVMGEPMIRIGEKNEISFNVCASNEYKLMECKSFDVYMDKGTVKTAIVFIPRNDTDGTFKAQHQPSYCYFNSIKLVRELSVPAGRYPVSQVNGVLVVEVPHG